MDEPTPRFDARILRETGVVAGMRPEIPLQKLPLEIPVPTHAQLPQQPVDAVLVLGMGPVDPVISHGKVKIGKPRMRHNALTAVEMAARGIVKKDGLVVPSGTATADKMVVEAAIQSRHSTPLDRSTFVAMFGDRASTMTPAEIELQWVKYRLAASQTPTLEQADQIYTATEAGLMKDLFNKAVSRITLPDGSRVNGAGTGVEVFVDDAASETSDNFINTLNELDRRKRQSDGKLFNGSIAVITSRYHIVRTMELARFLNLEGTVVPIISQEALKKFGYEKKLYGEDDEAFDIDTRWNEQKWIRAIHQMPEYLLPVLRTIQDNERFIRTLKHVGTIYGEPVMKSFGLENISVENVPQLRERLGVIIRKNPKEEEWLKTDDVEVNQAVDKYVELTNDWLAPHTPFQLHSK